MSHDAHNPVPRAGKVNANTPPLSLGLLGWVDNVLVPTLVKKYLAQTSLASEPETVTQFASKGITPAEVEK